MDGRGAAGEGSLNRKTTTGVQAMKNHWKSIHEEQDRALPVEISKISEGDQKAIAGFFDGDGTVLVTRVSRGEVKRGLPIQGKDYALLVRIYQSCNSTEPPELVWLRARIGGKISQVCPATNAHRSRWTLIISGRLQQLVVMEIVARHGVVKAPQAALALAFLRKELAGESTKDLISGCRSSLASMVVDCARLTPEYIAGIFGAEGTISIGSAIRIGIAQKSCPPLLLALEALFGGHVCRSAGIPKEWIIQAAAAFEFLNVFREFVFGQKKPQIDLVHEYVLTKRANGWAGGNRSSEKRAYTEEETRKLKIMKRG